AGRAALRRAQEAWARGPFHPLSRREPRDVTLRQATPPAGAVPAHSRLVRCLPEQGEYRHFKEGGVTRTFDPRRCHPVDWLLLLTVLLVPLGCSFSASSNSLSDSFASSSKSSKSSSDSSASSASSSPGDSAYYDNVRSTTEAYAKSGGPFDAYRLVDTFKSRLTPPGSPNSADKQSAIQKGYDSKK